jgi:hypothetical protein
MAINRNYVLAEQASVPALGPRHDAAQIRQLIGSVSATRLKVQENFAGVECDQISLTVDPRL